MQARNFFLGAVIGSLLGLTGFGHPNGSALAVLVVGVPLMAFGGADSETGTVAEQILQEAEDSVKQIRAVIEDARRGNPESQFQLGSMIRDNINEWYKRVPSNDLPNFESLRTAQAEAMLEARTWFTRAAEQGHDGAQMELSKLYRRKYPPDYLSMTDFILSYAWLKVALDKGASAYTTEFGHKVTTESWLRRKMTAEQVAEAEKLAVKIQERIESSKLE